jgi:tetratricopeptide (TPR) repeat protein
MTETSEIELNELIQELEKNSSNLDLINSVAIGYFENPSMLKDKEDLDYFELAYKTKKTVKSTHNLAWYLYFEWGEQIRATKIQKECIELNPNSFYPYYQLGYMLLDQKQFKEAIPYLEKAKRKENKRDIIHNLGYCYFQLKEYEKAKELFSISVTELDIENRSLFNLALTEYKCQNIDKVKAIADKLSEEIETNHHSTISGYEIGLLYFLINDFDKSAKCLIKQGIEGIDLLDWNELSYSLYQTNKPIWSKQINKSIKERTEWIDEINSNHEDWSEYSTQEKQERLNELRVEIQTSENTLKTEMTKPKQEIKKSLWVEYCGCLMFDCKRHGNKEND